MPSFSALRHASPRVANSPLGLPPKLTVQKPLHFSTKYLRCATALIGSILTFAIAGAENPPPSIRYTWRVGCSTVGHINACGALSMRPATAGFANDKLRRGSQMIEQALAQGA